jgi:hypothetical protein
MSILSINRSFFDDFSRFQGFLDDLQEYVFAFGGRIQHEYHIRVKAPLLGKNPHPASPKGRS